MIDVNSWTMKELADLEKLSGQSLSTLGDDKSPKARLMTSMAFIAKRRETPGFKLADAEQMTLEEITELLGMDTDDLDQDDDNDPKD